MWCPAAARNSLIRREKPARVAVYVVREYSYTFNINELQERGEASQSPKLPTIERGATLGHAYPQNSP